MKYALSSPKIPPKPTSSALGDLPTELLEIIFGYADNLKGIRVTCWRFKSIVGTRAFESIVLNLDKRQYMQHASNRWVEAVTGNSPLVGLVRGAAVDNNPLVDLVRGLHVVFLDGGAEPQHLDGPFSTMHADAAFSVLRFQLKKLDTLRLTFATDGFQVYRNLFAYAPPLHIRALTIDLHLFSSQSEWDLDWFSISNIALFLEEVSVISHPATLHSLTSLLTRLFRHAANLKKVKLECQPHGSSITAPYDLISKIGTEMRELRLVGFRSHRAWLWIPGDKHTKLRSLHLVDPSPCVWDTTLGDDEDPPLIDPELLPIPHPDGQIRLRNLTLQVKWIPATALKYLASYEGLERLEFQDHDYDHSSSSRSPISGEDGMAGLTPRNFFYSEVLRSHARTLRVLKLGCRNRAFPTRWYFGASSVRHGFDAYADVEEMCDSLRACVALEELRVSVCAVDGLELLLRTVGSPMKLRKLEVTVIPTWDNQTTWPRIDHSFRTFGPIHYGMYRRALEVFCDMVSPQPEPTVVFVLDDFQGGLRFVPLHDMQGKEVGETRNVDEPNKRKSRGRVRRILSMFL